MYPSTVVAEILGPDLLIVLLVVALLFGGTQLPKLARSLGAAQGQFRKGLRDGDGDGDDETDSKSKSKDI